MNKQLIIHDLELISDGLRYLETITLGSKQRASLCRSIYIVNLGLWEDLADCIIKMLV